MIEGATEAPGAPLRPKVTLDALAQSDIDVASLMHRLSGSRRVHEHNLIKSETQSLAGQRNRISALVPLAELTDYQARVKSLTGGEGSYTMELSHYDPVPPRKQQDLMKAFKHVEED
jgi:elongation factor G